MTDQKIPDQKIPENTKFKLMQHFRRNMHHGFEFKYGGEVWIVVDNEEVTPVKIVTAAPVIGEVGMLGKPERFVIDKLICVLAEQSKINFGE